MVNIGFALILFSILILLMGAAALPIILGIVGLLLVILGTAANSGDPEPDPWENEGGSDEGRTENEAAEDTTQTNIDL